MPDPDDELIAEQRYVDAAHARLDSMRRSASQVSAAYADVRRGGTHQARLERDIAHDVTHRRLAALDIGDAALVFGRLDVEPGSAREETRLYVGRVAVDDADHTPLVIDWRAPIAEPFYRATAVERMGVIRRRHFITHDGRLVGLDDEVFDAEATAQAGFTVVGEGALLSALERERTGRMGDIVATIQAEQDEAIRADLSGVLVVAGGAGTGKTAVALHRAAYLLYTYRRRLQSQGVLLVGPSSVFLRYIEEVLPSLGEHDVHLATLGALRPEVKPSGEEAVPVAAVKGDARMALVIAAGLADRQHVLPRDIVVPIQGLRLRVTRRDSVRILERTRHRRGSHNARRPFVTHLLLDHLVRHYRRELLEAYRSEPWSDPLDDGDGAAPLLDPTVAGALARGDAPPDGWEDELRTALRRRPEVREALDRMWPVLSGAELVRDLLGFPALIRSAAGGVLTPAEQAGLFRDRGDRLADARWTDADVALVDEAEALTGPVEAARPRDQRRGGVDAEALATARSVVEELGLGDTVSARTLAERFAEPVTHDREALPELRTYGHVLVDEAQDLTPMQWRMAGRRAPAGSLTLVGDFGQASRPGAAGGWDDVIALLRPHAGARVVNLTVNYRTPAEIMAVAHRILTVAAPHVEVSRAVRSTGEQPRFIAGDALTLPQQVMRLAREAREKGGRIVVIAPPTWHPRLVDALAELGAVAGSADALDAPVAILGPIDAKGLEFDHVVVVEPAALVAPDSAGLRLLYVALTRATQTLAVVHAEPLPEALA